MSSKVKIFSKSRMSFCKKEMPASINLMLFGHTLIRATLFYLLLLCCQLPVTLQ